MYLLRLIGVCLLLAGQLTFAEEGIRLKTGTIRRPSTRPAELGRHYLLRFRTEPRAALREELERRGIRVLGYVPDSALMVSSDAPPELDGLDVTWSGSLAPSEKLSPALAGTHPAAYLVVFHEDVSPAEARAIARETGFLILRHPDLARSHLLLAGSSRPLQELAAQDEVAYILPASSDLVSGQRVIACAGPLTEGGPVGNYVEVGPGWAKGPDGVVDLEYVFASLTPKVEESALRNEVARAFAEWARYAPIRFSIGEKPSAERTIAIRFARGAHGDEYPFDGPGGALAHTFFPEPPNTEPLAGDMHLDADERWRIGADFDVFTVALHEAGHALGLGHSDSPGSVMYPYYRMTGGLTAEDIAGIQHLYGSVASGSAPEQPVSPGGPAQLPPAQPPAAPPPPSGTDRTAPWLRILSPATTILSTAEASIVVRGTAGDATGVTSVRWTVSTGGSGVAEGTARWAAEVPLETGDNVIIVRAYDAAGNSGWRALMVVRR